MEAAFGAVLTDLHLSMRKVQCLPPETGESGLRLPAA